MVCLSVHQVVLSSYVTYKQNKNKATATASRLDKCSNFWCPMFLKDGCYAVTSAKLTSDPE